MKNPKNSSFFNPPASATALQPAGHPGNRIGNTPKTVAVLIRDVEQQYEGLRLSLGALLDAAQAQMFVLDHEIAVMDDAYRDNMAFLDEMGGKRFSNHPTNVEKYNFRPVTLKDVALHLLAADLVIPF